MERIIHSHPGHGSYSAAAILVDLIAGRSLVEGHQLPHESASTVLDTVARAIEETR
jgi:hypothetical protein